jgi:hypothetical protein
MYGRAHVSPSSCCSPIVCWTWANGFVALTFTEALPKQQLLIFLVAPPPPPPPAVGVAVKTIIGRERNIKELEYVSAHPTIDADCS